MNLNKFHISLFGLMLVIVYALVKDKNNKVTIEAPNAVPQVAPHQESTSGPSITQETNLPEETPVSNKAIVVSTETTLSESEPQGDPLTRKILNHSIEIQKKHEELLSKLLYDNNKEDLFDDYLALKEDRAKNISEQLKKDNSQKAIFQFNFKYHEKLHELFGDRIYHEYLKGLKKVNEESKRTKVVLEF